MAILGDLEHQIMTVLWNSPVPLTVREVHEHLLRDRDLAYTTVMTVLDRLAKKSIVVRELDGRAWLYRPARTAPELVSSEMIEVLQAFPDQAGASLDAFVRRLDAGRRRELTRVLRAVDQEEGQAASSSSGALNCD